MNGKSNENVNFSPDDEICQLMYANIDVGILLADNNGKILSANPAACALFGKEEQEICSSGWRSLAVSSKKEEKATFKTFFDTAVDETIQFIRSDGTKFAGELSANQIIAPDNKKRILLFIRDISKRIEAEKLLQASEAQYRRTLDNIVEACQIIGPDWRYIYLNKVAIEYSRKTEEELYGNTIMEIFPGIKNTEFFDAMQECMKHKTSRTIESPFKYESGEELFFELIIKPVPEGILVLGIDITERKHAEEKLKRSEENLRLLIENTPAAIAMLDRDMKYMYASRRFYSDYGVKDEDIIGRSHYEIFPEINDSIKQMHQKCLLGETFKSNGEPFPRANGSIDWVRWEIHPWYTHKGGIGGIILFTEVITEHKRAEEALQESEQRWRFALEGSGDGILDWNCKENSVFYSKRWKSMLGYNENDIGDTIEEVIKLIHPDHKEQISEDMERLYSGEISHFSGEYLLLCKDGSYKWILARGMAVSRDEQGNPIRIIGTHTDISNLKEAQESLRKSNRAYKLLSSCNEYLVRATSETELLDEICRVIVEEGDYKFAWICIFQSDGSLIPVAVRGTEFDIKHGMNCGKVNENCIANKAVLSRKPVILEDSNITCETVPLINNADGSGNASLVALPIINEGVVLGALNIYSSEHNLITMNELAIFTEFADDLAYGLAALRLQNVHKMTSEKLLASENRYRTLFESASEAIIMANAQVNKIELANPAACKMLGYDPEEFKALAIKDVYPENDMNFVLSELEKQFKGIKTVSPDIPLKRKDGTIIYTDIKAARMVIGGKEIISAFITDVTERKLAEKERESFEGKLLKAMIKTVELISRTVEFRDPYTAGHQERVTVLAEAIAKSLGLSKNEVDGIRMAAIVHDVGKICIPSEILSKPGRLTDLEFGIIKTHPQAGYDILKDVEFPWAIADIVLQHHERVDGSGYPNGLKGTDISLGARILAVADVVDAMASHRPYRPSLGIESALEEISKNSGILYDEKVVVQCLSLFENGFEFD